MTHDYSAGRKPGDRYTGLTKKQIALAATLSVTQSGLSEQELVELMFTQMIVHLHGRQGISSDKSSRIAKPISHQNSHKSYPPRPVTEIDIDHRSYITHLLQPGTASQNLVAEEFLDRDPMLHAKALDDLRAISRKTKDGAYEGLIAGDCGKIICGAYARMFPGHEPSTLIDVAQTHGNILIIRRGHDRVSQIARLSLAPFDDRFSGFKTWLTVGHSFLATITAPALIIQKLQALASDPRIANLDEAALFDRLVKETALPPKEEGRKMMSIIKQVIDKLHDRGIDMTDTRPLLDAIAKATAPAACLNRGDMKEAGWSKIDFPHFQTGLSATEASAFVAMRMMQALRRADECVAIIERGGTVSRTEQTWIPDKRPLAHASVILRSEGLPDRNAKRHDPSLTGYHIDKDRGSGRTAVESMLKKIADPEIRSRADKLLGIDAERWFHC